MDNKELEKNKEKIENNEIPKSKKIIVTLGHVLLGLFGLFIVITGSILYYLIYTNKGDIEQAVIEENNIIVEDSENVIDENTTVADLLGDVIETSTSGNSNNSTVTTSDASSRKVQNEELIVLYDGLLMDVSDMKEVDLKYIESTNTQKDKYVITYYNYENYSFVNSGLGALSTQVFDGLLKIDNVGKVAISESYNAIPRPIQVVNAVPTIISDNNKKIADYDTVKVIITDLDGNGTDEYILALANKKTGYSKICFVDSTGLEVTDLAYIEKSKWEAVSAQGYYLSISNVQIVDVDNDGVMEILVEIPKYEGEPSISLLKYKNGELTGDKNIECSLLP